MAAALIRTVIWWNSRFFGQLHLRLILRTSSEIFVQAVVIKTSLSGNGRSKFRFANHTSVFDLKTYLVVGECVCLFLYVTIYINSQPYLIELPAKTWKDARNIVCCHNRKRHLGITAEEYDWYNLEEFLIRMSFRADLTEIN